jgi:hypothetical protein
MKSLIYKPHMIWMLFTVYMNECVGWDYHIAWILQYVHHMSMGIPLYV